MKMDISNYFFTLSPNIHIITNPIATHALSMYVDQVNHWNQPPDEIVASYIAMVHSYI